MNRFLVLYALLTVTTIAVRSTSADEDLDLLEQQAFRAAVDRMAPSVVRIETIGGLERIDKVLFGTGPTTGVVLDKEGYVISSAFHFVNKPSSILVRLPDGSRHAARLVATDHHRMLVLLKIDAGRTLPVPETSPPKEMRVGQWAVALGRTFDGNRPNVAVGILSALNRVWGKAIQTDAAVSPNNYGGPLVDIRGRVLGVLVPMSPDARSEIAGIQWYDSGIGFAVPWHEILKSFPRMVQGKDLYPGLIGIRFGKASLFTGEPLVATVRPNSPASKAGLKAKDRIVEIDGRPIARPADVKNAIARHYAEDTIRVVVLRGKERIEQHLTLIAKLEPYVHPFLGILPMRQTAPDGVTVRYVYPDSPASTAGIQPGDRLTSFASEPITDAETFRLKIAQHKPEEAVSLEWIREEKSQKATVTLTRLPEEPVKELPPSVASKPRKNTPEGKTVPITIPELSNKARAYFPQGYDSKLPYGMIVYLHAAGKLDRDAVIRQWQPVCDRDGLILLAPEARDGGKWVAADIDFIGRLVEKLDTESAIDPTRIVLVGQSEGGTLAFLAAFAHRERIRGVVTIEGPAAGRLPENEPLYRTAFFLARSKKSRATKSLEATLQRLRKAEYPVTVLELGETPRDLTIDELTSLSRWIDALDRI